MSLSNFEKITAIAGFVPFVSSVSGIVMAFNYYDKAKKQNKLDNEQDKKIHDLAINKLNIDVGREKKVCYEKLWKASVIEAIPFINLIAAVYSTSVLNKLSQLREVNDNLENRNKFLIQKYGISKSVSEKSFSPEQKAKLAEALYIVDKLEAKDSNFTSSQQEDYKKAVFPDFFFGWLLNPNSNVSEGQLVDQLLTDFIVKNQDRLVTLDSQYQKEDSTQMDCNEKWNLLMKLRDSVLRKEKEALKNKKNQNLGPTFNPMDEIDFD